MKTYLAKRLLYFILLFFGVTLFTFAVTTSAPGGAIAVGSAGNAPFFIRYLAWLRVVLLGRTAGISWPRSAVFLYFGRMLPGTIKLAGVSLLVILLISLPLGLLCAIKKSSALDFSVRFLSFFGASTPNFILGFLLIFLVALRFRWFPVISNESLRSFILPVAAISIPLISRYVRHIRGVALEELGRDYVAGSKARGIRPWRVILCHVLPNALPSILTFLRVSIGQLLSGVVIIEVVFMWKGIGNLTISAIRSFDYPVIQAYALWMAVLYIGASFVLDLCIFIADRRYR